MLLPDKATEMSKKHEVQCREWIFDINLRIKEDNVKSK